MKISTDPNTNVLSLAGALEIHNAENVWQALLDYMAKSAELAIGLGEVESCDVSGAQLLWALRQSASQAGRPIRFENVSQPILDTWTALGLSADLFANKN